MRTMGRPVTFALFVGAFVCMFIAGFVFGVGFALDTFGEREL